MQPFVSACIIVKNEEKVIGRCLDSIKDIVDEIIVVDTGSTDKTKEIVQGYVQEVYEFEWTNSFADARNFAGSKAKGEWILVLDADEYVERENLKTTLVNIKKQQKDNNTIDAYNVNIINFMGSMGEQVLEHTNLRIYRNIPEIYFYRSIHEQLSRKQGGLIEKPSELVIYHSGYLKQTVKEKSKTQRNAALLEKEMSESKDSAFDYFNLANEYFSEEDFYKAIEYYKKAFIKKQDIAIGWVGRCIVQLINCLSRVKNYEEALIVIRDTEAIWEKSPDIQYLKAQIYYQQNRYEDAKEVALNILENPMYYTHVLTTPDVKELLPCNLLEVIYRIQKNNEKAIHYIFKALNINSMNMIHGATLLKLASGKYSNDEILRTINLLGWNQNKIIFNNMVNSLIVAKNIELANYFLKDIEDEMTKKTLAIKLDIYNNKFEMAMEKVEKLNVSELQTCIKQGYIGFLDLLIIARKVARDSFLKVMYALADEEAQSIIRFTDTIGEREELDNIRITYIEKCMLLNELGLSDFVIKEKIKMNPKSQLILANLFYRNGLIEKSIEFYNGLDTEQIDIEAYINLMQYFRECGEVKIALEYGLTALEEERYDYRIFISVIEILKECQDKNSMLQIIQLGLKHYPDSNYLKGFID